MTSLEKGIKVKEIIQDMCEETECYECHFNDEEDETKDGFYCSIRDNKKRVPYSYGWDMNTAML